MLDGGDEQEIEQPEVGTLQERFIAVRQVERFYAVLNSKEVIQDACAGVSYPSWNQKEERCSSTLQSGLGNGVGNPQAQDIYGGEKPKQCFATTKRNVWRVRFAGCADAVF